jgi:hypothetical protein
MLRRVQRRYQLRDLEPMSNPDGNGRLEECSQRRDKGGRSTLETSGLSHAEDSAHDESEIERRRVQQDALEGG